MFKFSGEGTMIKRLFCFLIGIIFLFTASACAKEEVKAPTLFEIGENRLQYLGCEVLLDCDKEKAVAISFCYTNHSEESKVFEEIFFYQITQNQIPLQETVIFTGDTVMGQTNWEDVMPGESKIVYFTYKLNDPTTSVTLNISDLFETKSVSWTIQLATLPNHSKASSNGETESDWWLGGWYGWWMVFDGNGKYQTLIQNSWDCCALAQPLGENGVCITVWDEDYKDYFNDPLSKVYLERNGQTDFLTEETKSFFWVSKVKPEDWSISTEYFKENGVFVITGQFTDPDGDFCRCGIVLCKWGEEWDPNVAPKPDSYDSYLAPLIKEGRSIPLIWNPKK